MRAAPVALSFTILATLTVPLPGLASAQFDENTANYNRAGVTIARADRDHDGQLDPIPEELYTAVTNARAAWNSPSCNRGLKDFPELISAILTGSNASNITIHWYPSVGPRAESDDGIRRSTNPTVCAETTVPPDSHYATIRVYQYMNRPEANIPIPCFTNQGIWDDTMIHEFGHYFGLDHPLCREDPNTGKDYIMAQRDGVRVNPNQTIWDLGRELSSTECTMAGWNNLTPNEQPSPGNEGIGDNEPRPTPPIPCTPIILDLEGNGLQLTDIAGGVVFDVDADGTAEHVAWTDPAHDDVLLAFDRNGNGLIDDGRELFGAGSPQVPAMVPNGFEALYLFDRNGFGGNADGVISPLDYHYPNLLVWKDLDQDGVSQPWELRTLEEAGIVEIPLEYQERPWRDRHGNQLRWIARARLEYGRRILAVDVVLQGQHDHEP